VILRILKIMLGGPAALALLAKLDDRLNFNPLLERIILNFETFYIGIWSSVSDYLGVDLTPFASLLTIITLLIVPVTFNAVRRATSAVSNDTSEATLFETRIRIFNGIMAVAFLVYVLVIFQLSPLIPAIGMIGGLITYGDNFKVRCSKETTKRGRIWAKFPTLALAMAYACILPFAVYAAIKSSNPGSSLDIRWWMLPMFCYPLTFLFWYATEKCTEALANVALCVLGIVLINWFSVTAIPSVSAYLDQIGV